MSDLDLARECLPRLAAWRAEDRGAWVRVGMALKSVSDSLFDDWDRWSRSSEKYVEKEARRQWRSFKPDGELGLGSLIYWAREDSGDTDFGQKQSKAKSTRRSSASRSREGGGFDSVEALITYLEKRVRGTHAGTWTYHYANGSVALSVVRIDRREKDPDTGKPKKEFRPVHEHGGRFKFGDPPGQLPIYGLPDLPAEGAVWFVEGEKAADAVNELGLFATTTAHGARGLERSDLSPLAGRDIVVFPDNDEAGRELVTDLVRVVSALKSPAKVRVAHLPDLPPKGDVVEFIEARRSTGKSASEIAEELKQHVKNAQTVKERATCEPVYRTMDQVEPQPVEWLWTDLIPLRKITMLVGDPNLGKSTVTADIIARVTRGRGFPPAFDGDRASMSAIILSAEDDPEDTIRPRLDAAGADVAKVVCLDCVRVRDRNEVKERHFSLADDLEALRRIIRERGDVRLIVIDPVGAYLGSVDENRNAEVRSILAPLAKLAADEGVAVLCIMHLNKNAHLRAVYRASGSVAFVAAARSVLAVAKDKKDPQRRILAPVKANLARNPRGLAYRIVSQEGTHAAIVEWEGSDFDVNVDEILGGTREPGKKVSKLDQAKDWLREFLREGPVPASDVEKAAESEGITSATLRRAEKELRVRRSKEGMQGRWYWGLPDDDESGGEESGEDDEGDQEGAQSPGAPRMSTFGDPEHLCSPAKALTPPPLSAPLDEGAHSRVLRRVSAFGDPAACHACGSQRHWRLCTGGPWICATCHPPATNAPVIEWSESHG